MPRHVLQCHVMSCTRTDRAPKVRGKLKAQQKCRPRPCHVEREAAAWTTRCLDPVVATSKQVLRLQVTAGRRVDIRISSAEVRLCLDLHGTWMDENFDAR
jgi:hypothetical protein